MEPRWYKPLRIISRVVIISIIVIVFITLAFAIFIYLRRDAIMQYALEHINQRLTVRITVENIDVRFLQTFPYVTLAFDNVYIPEANTAQADTLIHASAIRFNFNLLQLLRGNYVVRQIQIIDGTCRFKVFQNGKNNFQIWRADSSEEKSRFRFDLQSVQLRNVDFIYSDIPQKLHIATYLERGQLRGNFSDSTILLKYSIRGLANDIIVNRDTILWNKSYRLTGDFNITDNYQTFQFHKTTITLQNVELQFEGSYRKKIHSSEIDIRLINDRALLSDVIGLLPLSLQNKLNQFVPSGFVKLSVLLRGVISQRRLPSLEVMFELSDGTLKQHKTNEKIKNIITTIHFVCPDLAQVDRSTVDCQRLHVDIGDRSIEAKFSVKNLKNSTVRFTIEGEFNLQTLHEMFSLWSGIRMVEGILVLKTEGSFSAKDIMSIELNELYDMKMNGTWNAEEIVLTFQDNPEILRLSALKGSVDYQTLEILSARLHYAGNDFNLRGKCTGISDYLTQRKKQIHIDGSVQAKHLNLPALFAIDTIRTGRQSDTLYKLTLPSFLTANISIGADNITYDKFDAKNLNARMTFADNILLFRDVDLQAFDGRLNGEVMIDARRENVFSLNILARINAVNIQKAFYQLNNFGQKSLTDQHLNGQLHGTVHFLSKWNNNMTVDQSSITVVADITIQNGAIRNYPPLEGLKKYFRRRDFSYVAFDRLQNEIHINDRIITIPRMSIKSNVMDFEMEGTHSFDNNIDYRFQIRFAELLGGGQQKRPSAEEEYGYVVQTESGPAWFFRVTGTVDDPKFIPLDLQAVRQHRKEKMQQEREQVRQTIQQEFSSARRQTDRVREHKPDEKKQIIIEWSDE